MGKTISTVCKITSPLVALFNPVVGVILSSTAAIGDIIHIDHQRRKLNTLIDREIENERAKQLQVESSKLDKYLEEIQDLYNKNYSYLSDSKAIMEEYYFTIQQQLLEEQIIIEHLDEILELLHLCCMKKHRYNDNNDILAKLHKYRNGIFVLLQWGLMHISLLAGEKAIYEEVIKLFKEAIDCSEIDNLDHSILEYAYLIGDQELIRQLKNNQYIFRNVKLLKEAKLLIAKRKLTLNFNDNFQNDNLLQIIEKQDYELLQAAIILGNIPNSVAEAENLIKILIAKEQNILLEEILQQKINYINLELINSLEKTYKCPRNFNKETAILKLQTFWWLKQHNFNNINEFHSQTTETPLEIAITKGDHQAFINLLKCNANLSQLTAQGDTMLMVAIRSNNTSIVEYLIKNHEIDPRIYNLSLYNGLLAANHSNHAIKNLIINFSNQLSLEEKHFFKSVNPLINDALLEHVFINILSQASNYYRLLQTAKRSTTQVRLPIILGLYVLAIRQVMPLDENELSWIAKKLQLKVSYNFKEYNFSDLDLPLVTIHKIQDGYSASWHNNYLEIIEPEIQYMFPNNHFDLDLNIENDSKLEFININNYINNNYLMFENFKKHYIKEANNCSFRIDELPTKPTIMPKELTKEFLHKNIINKHRFVHYYDMPDIDAGYHALGISRFTAAKLLINNLDSERILECIKVEWVNWIISLYALPKEIINIKNVQHYLQNYQEAKKLWDADPENQYLLQKMQHTLYILYNLSNKEHCAMYVVKFVMAPYNMLNPLKYYPAFGDLPQGGILVALAKILKLNISVYQFQDNDLENIFDIHINNANQSIDILKYCVINNNLNKVAILAKNIKLHLKPVITHMDLFNFPNKDSDLGVIFHGWFNFLAERSSITPQNDLLALLLAVKSKIIEPNNDINISDQINHLRYLLSKELSILLGKQFKEFQQLDTYWVNVAERKIKNIAREYLLKEHYKIIANYQEQSLLLKEMLGSELEKKFSTLNQEQLIYNQTLKEIKEYLSNWAATATLEAIQDSNKRRLIINSDIDQVLSEKHNSIKKYSKKMMKSSIINFVVNYVFTKVPKCKNLTEKILIKSGCIACKSVLNKDPCIFKKIAETSVYQILDFIPLNENLLQVAVKGMTENFITNVIHDTNNKHVIKATILGGMQAVCNFGIQHHIKFSESYINSIFSGSVDALLEGIKKNNCNLEELLVLAANKIASNLENNKTINIVHNIYYKTENILLKKFIFHREKDLNYFSKYFSINEYSEVDKYNSNDINTESIYLESKEHNQNVILNNQANKNNFNKYWVQSILDKLTKFKEQEIKEIYGLNECEVKILRRKKMPKTALFFDEINTTEEALSNTLYKFKKNSLSFLHNEINKFNNDLISLDLSISQKMVLHSKKLAAKATLVAAENWLPDSTTAFNLKILKAAVITDLYWIYKLGLEFTIPGTGIRVAPLGNRTNHPLGKLPHYHRRVPDPNNPNASLPGQGFYRHRPWETPKNKKGEQLKIKFKDRF